MKKLLHRTLLGHHELPRFARVLRAGATIGLVLASVAALAPTAGAAEPTAQLGILPPANPTYFCSPNNPSALMPIDFWTRTITWGLPAVVTLMMVKSRERGLGLTRSV